MNLIRRGPTRLQFEKRQMRQGHQKEEGKPKDKENKGPPRKSQKARGPKRKNNNMQQPTNRSQARPTTFELWSLTRRGPSAMPKRVEHEPDKKGSNEDPPRDKSKTPKASKEGRETQGHPNEFREHPDKSQSSPH